MKANIVFLMPPKGLALARPLSIWLRTGYWIRLRAGTLYGGAVRSQTIGRLCQGTTELVQIDVRRKA